MVLQLHFIIHFQFSDEIPLRLEQKKKSINTILGGTVMISNCAKHGYIVDCPIAMANCRNPAPMEHIHCDLSFPLVYCDSQKSKLRFR